MTHHLGTFLDPDISAAKLVFEPRIHPFGHGAANRQILLYGPIPAHELPFPASVSAHPFQLSTQAEPLDSMLALHYSYTLRSIHFGCR